MGKARPHPKRRWWKKLPPGGIVGLPDGDIVCCDALALLSSLREGCADIVFLDPPFNLGKKYGTGGPQKDRVDEREYLARMTEVLWRSCEVLNDGGALYLYHIPKWAIEFAAILKRHLQFRHWISISMKNGFVRPQHLYPAHYALLYFTKGKPGAFQRPKTPVLTCRHCGKYVKDYGGYRKYVQDGINLSDVWDDISPVRHRKYKHRGPNELPLEVPRRAVMISGRQRGLLVDPFAGTGTTLVAARESRMRFVASDIEAEYCQLMVARLSGEVANAGARRENSDA